MLSLLRAIATSLVYLTCSAAQGMSAAEVSELFKDAKGAKLESIASRLHSFATLAEDVYDTSVSASASGRKVGKFKVISDTHNTKNGLHFRIYKSEDGLLTVVAVEGTTPAPLSGNLADWRENFLSTWKGLPAGEQFLNGLPLPYVSQYSEALRMAQQLLDEVKPPLVPNIVFVGHSLGGGIVQFISSHTSAKAIGFNSVPLNPVIAGPNKDAVLHFCSVSDPVCDKLRRWTGFENAGKTFMYDPKGFEENGFSLLGAKLPNHSMSFLKQLLYNAPALVPQKLDASVCAALDIDDEKFCLKNVQER